MTKDLIEEKYRAVCGIKDDYKFTTDEEYLINEIFKAYNKGQKLPIHGVVKSFTAEEVVNELEDCGTLDDAIMFFTEKK